MSHQKYTTKAFVVSVAPQGECDALVTLFTKDFGLLRVKASGARSTKSKIKLSLRTLSLGDATVLRGKEIWRLFEFDLLSSCSKSLVVHASRVFELLKRLVSTEEPISNFFEKLEIIFNNNYEGDIVEIYLVTELLRELGYWKGEQLNGENLDVELEFIRKNRLELIKSINQSLQETQL